MPHTQSSGELLKASELGIATIRQNCKQGRTKRINMHHFKQSPGRRVYFTGSSELQKILHGPDLKGEHILPGWGKKKLWPRPD